LTSHISQLHRTSYFFNRRRAESPAADPDDPVILPDRLIVHPLTLEKYANINCVYTIDRTGRENDRL